MRTLLENAGLIVMLVIAATALIKFRARRYLIVLITGTAVGACLIGYAFGARWAAETVYPFVQSDRIERAKAVVEADLPSPLWGLALGVAIIFLDYLAFGSDVRKSSRSNRVAPAPESSSGLSRGSRDRGTDGDRLKDYSGTVDAHQLEQPPTAEGM